MCRQKVAIVFLGLVLVAFPRVVSAQCLKCTNGWQPPAGHGPASATDNRRRITIFIDWGNPTPTKLWNAVAGAVARWNDATDQYNNKTPYYFVVDQGKQISTVPDITIKSAGPFQNTTATCGQQVYACGTWEAGGDIQLADENLSSSLIEEEHLIGRVAHELSHLAGLHSDPCNSYQSILSPARPDGTQAVTTVKPGDVAAVNAAFNNPSGCDGTGPTTQEIDWGASGDGEETTQSIENQETEIGGQSYRCTNWYTVTTYYYWSDNGGWVPWMETWDYLYSEGCQPMYSEDAEVADVRVSSMAFTPAGALPGTSDSPWSGCNVEGASDALARLLTSAPWRSAESVDAISRHGGARGSEWVQTLAGERCLDALISVPDGSDRSSAAATKPLATCGRLITGSAFVAQGRRLVSDE